ncbi:hypothetical protein O181_016148 [Austropuccinia psidii MF-1]|uniref:Uncharacterized protein n=1 Tax=Austropuccinia psidii MF-1 TaxID=1389203 RepID=A0A9Q3C3S9_9BASI|nr:hypothetical protein [Austropuccinia psidii MF-1]
MHINFELDTRYHERQKEKGGNQENKPPVTAFNASRTPQDSYSKRTHHKKNKKDKKFQVSKDKPHAALLNKDNKLIGSEKLVCVLIVVGITQLKNDSKDLRTSLGHQEDSLARRKNPEWES